MKPLKKYVYIGIPLIGILFYLVYLYTASIDMVYSDYIRLIHSYLPDVWNPQKFFVPDLLTRIPVNYLERGLNVELFGYSVTFDRVMGVAGFGLSALAIGRYAKRQEIPLGWYTALMVVMFSLNQWEMLYNGTGWAHFLAFACFYYHYDGFDRYYRGERTAKQTALMAFFPALVTIGIAGPYCAVYTATLILAYLFLAFKEKKQRRSMLLFIACAAFPLLLYLWSNSQAVYEYSGAVQIPLLTALFQEPKFFIKFFLKSFASTVFGVELISRHMPMVPDKVWCLLGLIVLLAYFFALWMNFYCGIAEETILPLMLLAGGGMNHLMVLVSRYIFMPNDTYGMSSRYALQYQAGILGIFLTFALASRMGYLKKQGKAAKGGWQLRLIAGCIAAMFLAGNLITTAEEFSFGKHRKHRNQEVREILLNFEEETDETLQAALEYRKPGCREALSILKENGWNLFREQK